MTSENCYGRRKIGSKRIEIVLSKFDPYSKHKLKLEKHSLVIVTPQNYGFHRRTKYQAKVDFIPYLNGGLLRGELNLKELKDYTMTLKPIVYCVF
jgi:hypothetical protein